MAGAPTSLISLGHGFEYGRAIVTDPRVNAAAFTGSREGGRALFDLAQSRANPIPFYGELGSINPVVALNSALAEPAIFAGAYLDSLLLGGGQFCTNPSLLFMPVNSDFLAEVETQIKHRAPQTLLSKSTKQMHESNRTALKVALNPRVFTGKEAPGVGFYSSPEVLVASASDIDAKELFATECFGPTGLIVTYQEISEVLNILKELDGALVGSLFALSSDKDAKSVTDSLANVCGRVTWNAWPTGVAVTSGQQHGGPYPASTSPLHTSVGVHAIERFLRPVTFQGFPDELMENA
jgi:NADP-dependent aldehyde dehydrogenase